MRYLVLLGRHRDAGRLAVDDEARDSLVALRGVGVRHHQEDARLALVIHILLPFSTHESPWRLAVVFMANASLPEDSSDRQKLPTWGLARDSVCCCCRLQCATSTYGVGRETRQQLGLLLLVAVLAQHRVDQSILHVANLRVSQSSSNAEFVHASVSNEGDRGLTHR